MKLNTSAVTKSCRACLAAILIVGTLPGPLALAQATAPSAAARDASLKGRTVEDVRILGNNAVSTVTIRNLIRVREGDRFDPATVEEDYQRVYALRKFANVEARVEPTATGVIVIFQVTEQKQIRQITFKGNAGVDTAVLSDTVARSVSIGEAIDRFRINLARQELERLYKSKNRPFARVTVPAEPLAKGELVFDITEGPMVRVRRVQILGNNSYTDDKLKDQIKTRHWIWIFRPGTYDADQVEEDVASLRQWYEQHGFFDVRVGRKTSWSTDQSEVMVTFVIEEGPRYKIDKVTFKGNTTVGEADLRATLKMVEGRYYDADALRRDVKQIVRAYSPYGFIYQPNETDDRRSKDYLQIKPEPILRREAGSVGLVYEISEGRPMTIGRIRVRGNERIQEKVFLREMRVAPGQLYNSGEIQDAQDRIRNTRLVSNVTVTPIGDAPDQRDLLIEVTESQTAFFLVGAGLTSNAGVLGNISYEQRNFDITNLPGSFDELFSRKAFTGAGQYFRILLEPGTEQTRARVTFEEPWMFDQPYSFRSDLYYSTRQREEWEETRTGAAFTLGHRFTNEISARVTARGEDVLIGQLNEPFHRAPEIIAAKGHSTLTTVAIGGRYDTTDNRVLPSRGIILDGSYEYAGAFGGDYSYHKFIIGFNKFQTLHEDLLDRKTILSYRADAGYIAGDAPFFERFYAGGLGSVRGFRFRGISPRQGVEEDPIGGSFSLTGSAEVNFPIASDLLRGVVFADVGTVESDVSLGTVRSSVGVGIRLTLPIFGQLPLALDFGIPITKDQQDDTRFLSFSLGFVQ